MYLEKYSTFKVTREQVGFYSSGPKGVIEKRIAFQCMNGEDYNLAFGDWNRATSDLDDQARSNNQDMQKILNTVAFEVLNFIERHPYARIYIRGSSPARTRKYQMGIGTQLAWISERYNILGYIPEYQKNDHQPDNSGWERFRPGKNYERFLVFKRINYI